MGYHGNDAAWSRAGTKGHTVSPLTVLQSLCPLHAVPGGGACSASGGQYQVIPGAEAQDVTLQFAIAPDSRES